MSGRRGWILAAVVFLGVAAGAGGFVLLTEDLVPRLPSLPAQSPTSPRQPTDTPPPTRSEATSSTLPELTAEVGASMDEIQRQVAALRGLDPLAPVERSLLTPEDLRQRILDDFLSDYTEEEAAIDSRMLALLGLLDPGVDLRTLYADLLSEQVAGYYDDEAPGMFVALGAGFAGPERLTYAHEYDHALQDQHFDIDQGLGYNDEACDADRERCAAVNALLEGDATLLQAQWLRTFSSDQDQVEIQDFFATYESPVYDRAPLFLQKDLLFPYLQGLGFVSDLFIEGDWAAVDEAYLQPPVSTEQILHPERYPDDVPIALEVPDPAAALGDGWSEQRHEPLGEWITLQTLGAVLPPETAAEAAEGWGGDTVIILTNETTGQAALLLVTRWDTLVDAQEFLAAFTQYGNDRFGRGTSTTTRTVWADDEEYSMIERSADQTLWILAPDQSTGEALREGIPLPVDLR